MIGLRIATLRKKKGLSQDQLAKQINICASAIGMYEQGRREPPIKTLVALAKVLEVSLDYLITGRDTQNGQATPMAGVLVSFRTNLSKGMDIQLLSEVELISVITMLKQGL